MNQSQHAAFAIETQGLARRFGGTTALDALDLRVPHGAVFGFLGPNGAGKTTTLRLLLGLLRPTDGVARVLGFDPLAQGSALRARVGVVLDRDGLYDRLSAFDNLLYYARISLLPPRLAESRLRQMLEAVGLWERRAERVAGWSKGMRRRLALTRALLAEPALLLLDEPFAGLDPKSAVELRERIAVLARESGTTVFLTTHNLDEAERMCSLVGIIARGRLMALDSPERLRSAAIQRVVRVKASLCGEQVVHELRGLPAVSAASLEAGGVVVCLAAGASVNSVLSLLLARGAVVEEVQRVTPRLEEVYLSLIGGEHG